MSEKRCEGCAGITRRFDDAEEAFPDTFRNLVPAIDGPRYSSEEVRVLQCPACAVTNTYERCTLEPFRKRS